MGYGTLIGLALAAAGTGVSVAAANKSRRAMNDQVSAGIRRQEAYQKQATPIFNSSLEESGVDRFGKTAREAEGQALGDYEQSSLVPDGTNPLPVDNDRLKLQVARSRTVAARGEGYQEGFNKIGLGNADARNQLAVISRLAAGSAANTGILTQLAGSSGADMAGIGSLLSTAGSLASLYGASRATAAPTVKGTVAPTIDTRTVA